MRAAAEAADRPALAALLRDHPFLAVHGPEAAAIRDALVADYAGRDLLALPTALPVTAADLASLGMPVTALAGALDTPHRRLVAAAIANAAPAGRLIIVPGAGHLCNLDRPDLCNARLGAA
jgi:pimeloyl-ACP methyl ester carboxylesterase